MTKLVREGALNPATAKLLKRLGKMIKSGNEQFIIALQEESDEDEMEELGTRQLIKRNIFDNSNRFSRIVR